tara:strand:+ start:1562 stop:2320 length:759 start_codon:yes stop_codon:yes gene_type:complete
MASVNAVYKTLTDLVNKDQNGFITPSVFNSFAQVAQVRIFNRLFSEIKDAKRNNRASFNPGRDKSRFKQIEEDLALFASTSVLTKDATSGTFLRSAVADLSRIISATTNGSILLGQSTRTPIEMCYDEDKIERILISDISAPSEQFPVALVSENIEVFPESINTIRLRYYKFPEGVTQAGVRTATPPTYAYTTSAGVEVFNSANSVDFELPDHYLDDLVIEIAELAGINLRDQFIHDASGAQQNQVNQKKSY